MATFPAIAPVHSAPKRTSVSPGAFLFGDGYERATRFGINTVRPEWQLAWEVSATDADTIETFLQAQCDAGNSFDWQPPDAVTPLRWRCDEWNVEQIAYNWFRVSASFRRVFELTAIPVIVPTAATCNDDLLCDADIGPKPVITAAGRLILGQTLTATVDCAGPIWQWFRNSAPIAGATESTYVLTAADASATITVAATCLGFSPGVSDPVYLATGTISPTGTTTVTWTGGGLYYRNTVYFAGYEACQGTFIYGSTPENPGGGLDYPGSATITGGIIGVRLESEFDTANNWQPATLRGQCGGYGNSLRLAVVRANGTSAGIGGVSSQGQSHDYYSLFRTGLTFTSTEPDAVPTTTFFI